MFVLNGINFDSSYKLYFVIMMWMIDILKFKGW